MGLLWMDRTGLAVVKTSLSKPSIAVLGSDGITVLDIEWAEGNDYCREGCGSRQTRRLRERDPVIQVGIRTSTGIRLAFSEHWILLCLNGKTTERVVPS